MPGSPSSAPIVLTTQGGSNVLPPRQRQPTARSLRRTRSRLRAAGKALTLEPQSPVSRLNNIIPEEHGLRGSASDQGAGEDKARSQGAHGGSRGLAPLCPRPWEGAALTPPPCRPEQSPVQTQPVTLSDQYERPSVSTVRAALKNSGDRSPKWQVRKNPLSQKHHRHPPPAS